jgi:predicted AAA+ superfamily ATPase
MRDFQGIGKTTLARSFVPAGSPNYFDLEDPRGLAAIDDSTRPGPQLGINVPAPAMRRFWTMLAHLNGRVWNAADPARSLGVNQSTVRRHLDRLTRTFMVRQLQPWFENLGKRQVKAPKIYFRDCGLLHELLGAAASGSSSSAWMRRA